MVNEYDDNFCIPKIKAEYPFILLKNVGNELPIILDSLPAGSISLAILREGKNRKIKNISKTPIVINRLLRLYTIYIVLSPTKEVEIKTIEELLNLGEFIWME